MSTPVAAVTELVTNTVDVKDLQIVTHKRSSIYRNMLDQIAALRDPKKAVVMEIPKGKDPKSVLNGITSGLAFRGVKAPAGFSFQKRLTTGGKLAVYLGAARKTRAKSKK